jgi:hypothetical protein
MLTEAIQRRIDKYRSKQRAQMETKAAHRELVQRHLEEGMRLQYVRTPRYSQYHAEVSHNDENSGLYEVRETVSKGDPYGVVVSKTTSDGKIYFGWSMLNRKAGDKYDRDLGIIIAAERLAPLDEYMNDANLPGAVRRAMAVLVGRNIRYYKGE